MPVTTPKQWQAFKDRQRQFPADRWLNPNPEEDARIRQAMSGPTTYLGQGGGVESTLGTMGSELDGRSAELEKLFASDTPAWKKGAQAALTAAAIALSFRGGRSLAGRGLSATRIPGLSRVGRWLEGGARAEKLAEKAAASGAASVLSNPNAGTAAKLLANPMVRKIGKWGFPIIGALTAPSLIQSSLEDVGMLESEEIKAQRRELAVTKYMMDEQRAAQREAQDRMEAENARARKLEWMKETMQLNSALRQAGDQAAEAFLQRYEAATAQKDMSLASLLQQ